MSDDTPTQRFDAQSPANDGERKSRLPLILGIIGGVLLIAVIVLLVLLLGRNAAATTAASTDSPIPTDSSAASSTPVPTPTVTVTVTPAPTGNSGGGSAPQKPNGKNVLITQYTISPSTVDCSAGAPAGSTNLHITWKSLNGNIAYFGVETVDAQAGGMGWNLPASGTQHDFPAGYDPFTYVCGNSVQHFTITVVGIGSRQSLTFTVHRK
jgi:hypothetical protein